MRAIFLGQSSVFFDMCLEVCSGKRAGELLVYVAEVFNQADFRKHLDSPLFAVALGFGGGKFKPAPVRRAIPERDIPLCLSQCACNRSAILDGNLISTYQSGKEK